MARTFAITTTANENLKADAKGHAESVFTVTNTSPRPVRGLAKAKALDSTKQEWLKLAGESERDFAPGATQQFIISFDGPATTPATASAPKGAPAPAGSGAQPSAAAAPAPAKYSFRLDVASAVNPDEDFIEGPVVTVEMAPIVKKTGHFPFWIIPVALVVLIGICVGLWFLLHNRKVQVPDVVGKQFAEAKTAIEDAKLVVVQKEVQLTHKAPEGQVLNQDPKPGGDKVKAGTEINLTIEGADPLVVVPDVVKQTADDAKKHITEAGLTAVESGTAVTEGFEANQVTSQKPGAGEQVKAGATIELTVASQKVVEVPDVTFKPLALAKQKITELGLQVVEKEPELADASVAPGNVKRQTPDAKSKVPPNSSVELVAAAVPTEVPPLQGRKIAEAQFLLQQKGLSLGTVWGSYNESNASTVSITGQTPAAGTQVAHGSNVNVTVPCVFLGCRLIKFEGIKMMKALPTRDQPFEVRRPQ